MPPPIVQEFQDQLDSLGSEVLQAHPQLHLETWSHSLGEANDLDGWTLGFVIYGLECPLELALDLFTIHRRPRVARVMASWLSPAQTMSFVWYDFNGHKSAAGLPRECHEAILRGVERGAPGPGHGSSASITMSEDMETGVKTELSQDEREVYTCWVDHNVRKPYVWNRMDGFGFCPDSHPSTSRLAQLLETSVEVIEALFPRETVDPELLSPFVKLVDWPCNIEEWRHWRQLYREEPLCSGILYLSPVGFAEDRAVLLSANTTGNFFHDLQEDECLDRAVSLVSFQKVAGIWQLRQIQPIPWKRAHRAIITGILFLAGRDWGELTGVRYSRDDLQPCLDLTWKLKDGSEHQVQVAPNGLACDGNPLRVDTISPLTVLQALDEHFRKLSTLGREPGPES